MATEVHRKVADIQINADRPTRLSFTDLHTWVIWQFPHPIGKAQLCGAVKPPIPEHPWFAAIIHHQTSKVQVYGHLTEAFESPEAAAEFFHTNQNGGKL